MAAMRYAGKIRLQHTHRIYTDLTAEVSEESRKKFEKIIEIDTTGVSGLMPDFKDAITAALTSLKAVSDADKGSNPERGANPRRPVLWPCDRAPPRARAL